MSETLKKDFYKMPEGYNFSHKGVNWKEYENDFTLRTDAVWEKEQLRDWFRLFTKVYHPFVEQQPLQCFYYDKSAGKYSIIEPEDLHTMVYEPWALEDSIYPFNGMTPTGRTQSFQVGLGPKQKIWTPFSTYQSQQDYFTLQKCFPITLFFVNRCALRFEKWFQCDQALHFRPEEEKTKEYYMHRASHYPCYAMFYEASYACSDDMFDFLMELAYTKRANQTFEYNIFNHEMNKFPTVYDSPKNAERIKKTY